MVNAYIVINPGQIVAQMVHQLAQIGLCLFVGRIGPEEKGELTAGLGYVTMKKQVGQQGLQARLIEARYGLIPVEQVKIAQEMDVEDWHWGLLVAAYCTYQGEF